MNTNRSHLILASLLLIIVVAACAFSPAAANPPGNILLGLTPSAGGGCANAYFPTSSGTTWSYSSRGSVLGDYTFTRTVADVSATGFTMNDLTSLAAGTSSSVKWNCQNGNLAALDAGAASLNVASTAVKITSTSVTADGYNIPNTFAAGTAWAEKVTVLGTVTSGNRSMDSQIVSALKCTAGAGAESVKVPAGAFDAVKASCTETIGVSAMVQATPMPAGVASTLDITNWYAKGVGLVKSVRVNNTTGNTTTIELTSYKIQ